MKNIYFLRILLPCILQMNRLRSMSYKVFLRFVHKMTSFNIGRTIVYIRIPFTKLSIIGLVYYFSPDILHSLQVRMFQIIFALNKIVK